MTYASNPRNSAQLGSFTDPWLPANSSRLIVDHAVDFLQRIPTDDPFYLNVWFHASHAPMNPTHAQLQQFPASQYCAWSGFSPDLFSTFFPYCPKQILRATQYDLDQQVGRLLDYLEVVHTQSCTAIVIVCGQRKVERSASGDL